MSYPKQVTIIEVGPRDGLQNEPLFVTTEKKIALVELLGRSGLQRIEVTSFVSPKAIPQLADNQAVYSALNHKDPVRFSALIPNSKGLSLAIACGVKEIAVFTAASDTFNQRNINCNIAESLLRIKEVLLLAKKESMFVRAYISCALGCPYEGAVAPQKVAGVAQQLLDLGVDEICLGDTIGVGTPKQTGLLVEETLKHVTKQQLAMHFHDTYGQALANIYTSLHYGISNFDSSVAGLGGCPYARGASGNVATEDVLYMMHGLGIETGVDIYKVVHAGDMICKALGRRNQSKAANALLANPC